jgi:hypothetical protein
LHVRVAISPGFSASLMCHPFLCNSACLRRSAQLLEMYKKPASGLTFTTHLFNVRSTGFIGPVATFAAGVFSAATPNPCTGIRDGSATLAARFALTARNTTGPQVDATGAPLVLGPGGATDGEEFYVLAVRPRTPAPRRGY